MKIEDFFNERNVIDLSFFNFRNAITAAYFADADLRVLKVNDNFRGFFPPAPMTTPSPTSTVCRASSLTGRRNGSFGASAGAEDKGPRDHRGEEPAAREPGDAILVFFGDPESEGETEDALKCVEMALRMRLRTEELQKYWQKIGVSRGLHVRMGIAAGYCTVGNFGAFRKISRGSSKRIDPLRGLASHCPG